MEVSRNAGTSERAWMQSGRTGNDDRPASRMAPREARGIPNQAPPIRELFFPDSALIDKRVVCLRFLRGIRERLVCFEVSIRSREAADSGEQVVSLRALCAATHGQSHVISRVTLTAKGG